MHIILQLVVNCNNFVTINNNTLGFFHCTFSGFNDNLLHNHLLANGIKLVLARCVFHLQKLKELFHFLKIYQRLTKLQKQKNNNKLSEFVFIVYSGSINTHHLNNDVLTPTSPQLFVVGMLTIC